MKNLTTILFIFILLSCAKNDDYEYVFNNSDDNPIDEIDDVQDSIVSILSLGDSYTIGQSVCETCRFPEQLKDSLISSTQSNAFDLKIIAQTGWTTTNLINAVNNEDLESNYDLITLLIGVNNQYQHLDFSLYQSEFPQLVQMAISAANGNKDKLIVISIPDYAYTTFGQQDYFYDTISPEIDQYNAYAENYCESLDITYVYITDITRLGIEQPELVASDGLHPSELAYSKFVERILPHALEKID